MTTIAATKATAVALSQGKVQFNDVDDKKPWYTGQLSKVKRGDWVQWMAQYSVQNQPLPAYTYISGIVLSVTASTVSVFVACVPPEATGIGYGDTAILTREQILEHTPHDTEASEFFMSRPLPENPKQKLGSGIWNPNEEIAAVEA